MKRTSFVCGFFLVAVLLGCQSKTQKALNEGRKFFEQGELNKAIVAYQTGLKINPKDKNLLYENGFCYLLQGNFNTATANFTLAMKEDPSFFGGYRGIGLVALATGNYETAEQMLKKAVVLNPNYGPLYTNLGSLYLEQGNFLQATKHFQKGIKLTPNFADLKNGLLHLSIKQKEFDRAIAMGQDLLKLQYKQKLQKLKTHHLLLQAYLGKIEVLKEQKEGAKKALIKEAQEKLKSAQIEFPKDTTLVNYQREIVVLVKESENIQASKNN